MLIDEISEGLQPSIISRLSNALGAERERGNVAMALVEQNLSFALSIGSRAVREPTWTPIRISRRTGATYDHSLVWSAQEAFALFPSVNSGSSGARPLEGYLYEVKKGDHHVRNMVRLLLRWIAETESTSKNGITEDYIAELKDELEDAEKRLRELETREQGESRRSANT